MKLVDISKTGVTTVALLVAFASGASAGTITISGNPGYRSGLGGEFNVRAVDAEGAAILNTLSTGYVVDGANVGTAEGTRMNPGFGLQLGFQTFCIEFNEHIGLNQDYTVTIEDGAIRGGVKGGVGDPPIDLISVGTAYLYSKFVNRSLEGYEYTPGLGRAASAVMLQEAFWYLEDEIDLTADQKTANTFLSQVISLYGDGTGVGVGGAKANDTVHKVRALNLWGSNPAQKQSQLVMVPDGGLTATLLGLGLGGLAMMRRKSS